MENLKYCQAQKIDSVHRSDLNQAKELKKRTRQKILFYREQLKNEPLGGQRSAIRLQLLILKDDHDKLKQWEQEALRNIEKRANELGLTIYR